MKQGVWTCMYALRSGHHPCNHQSQQCNLTHPRAGHQPCNGVAASSVLQLVLGRLSCGVLSAPKYESAASRRRAHQRSSAASAPLLRRPATLPLRYSLAARLDAPPKGVAAYSRHRCRGARLAGWLPTAQF